MGHAGVGGCVTAGEGEAVASGDGGRRGARRRMTGEAWPRPYVQMDDVGGNDNTRRECRGQAMPDPRPITSTTAVVADGTNRRKWTRTTRGLGNGGRRGAPLGEGEAGAGRRLACLAPTF